MEPCNAEKFLKNVSDDSSLEGEDTKADTLAVGDPSHGDEGSRPISIDTIKRDDSAADFSRRAFEKGNEASTTPSTPSTASPLPSPAIPTTLIPSEATDFEAMSYHQSFFNDQPSSDDEPDPESPILIATPVNLLVPPTKPNLIFIAPAPFHSRSSNRETADAAFVTARRSARNTRSGAGKNYSRPSPRVNKSHRRRTSSLTFHPNYSSHDLSISSTSSHYSTAPSGNSATTGQDNFTPDPSSSSPDRAEINRSKTIKGIRSKRNRNTYVHDRGSMYAEENRNLNFSQERMTISYPDVGTWSRNVDIEERHMYSTTTPQSEIPPVPPLTPTSIPVPSSPSRAGTPPTETASISPGFHGQDHYHARTTSDRSTGTDNSLQSPYSTSDAAPDAVPIKSLRRHKRIYTSERPQSLRSLHMESYSHGGDIPHPPSSTRGQIPPHRHPNNPSRKSLPFPYQHIYQQIPGQVSTPPSPLERPSSIRSISLNHNQSTTSLAHTISNSNLSMHSVSYADSEFSGDDNVESSRTPSSNKQRISRKKSMKYLRDTKETMVGRVMNKNLMGFGLGSWKRKNSTGSNNSNSGMTTPIASYEESMVRA